MVAYGSKKAAMLSWRRRSDRTSFLLVVVHSLIHFLPSMVYIHDDALNRVISSHAVLGEEDKGDRHAGEKDVGVSDAGGADARGVRGGRRAARLQVSHLDVVRRHVAFSIEEK